MKRSFVLFLALMLCVPLFIAACGGGGGGGIGDGVSTGSDYNSSDTPVAIPDNNLAGVTSYINVSGFAGTIFDITVDLYIDHTWDADLIIDLLSPEGTLIILADQVVGAGENFHYTTFDELASEHIWTGFAPFTGSYRPEDSLSMLYGEDPNGTWELTVVDTFPEDTGVLRGWGLNIY